MLYTRPAPHRIRDLEPSSRKPSTSARPTWTTDALRPRARRFTSAGRRPDTAPEPDLARLHLGDLKVVLDPILISYFVRVEVGRLIGDVVQQHAEAICHRQITRCLVRPIARVLG